MENVNMKTAFIIMAVVYDKYLQIDPEEITIDSFQWKTVGEATLFRNKRDAEGALSTILHSRNSVIYRIIEVYCSDRTNTRIW